MSKLPADITVIVRAHDRPPAFLKRALKSVADQSRLPSVVLVVNDSEGHAAAEEVLKAPELQTLGMRHLPRDSRTQPQPNRSTALNRGILAATTQWIAFLDDDDTWAPTFIEAVASRLPARPGKDLGGVVTQTEAVDEKWAEGGLREMRRRAFNPRLRWLDIAALAVENQFTLNALVIGREIAEAVGGFREDLPMLEDWEFNVRVAAQYHIDVIPQPLARYHFRESSGASPNSNVDAMLRARALIRNEWLRADLAAGRIGFGQLTLAGEGDGLSAELSRLVRWRERIARLFRRAR